jgi:hypothetical protein
MKMDAHDGKCLWNVGLGGTVASGPISYSVDGHQYGSPPKVRSTHLP